MLDVKPFPKLGREGWVIEHLPSVHETRGSLPQHQLTDTLHTHCMWSFRWFSNRQPNCGFLKYLFRQSSQCRIWLCVLHRLHLSRHPLIGLLWFLCYVVTNLTDFSSEQSSHHKTTNQMISVHILLILRTICTASSLTVTVRGRVSERKRRVAGTHTAAGGGKYQALRWGQGQSIFSEKWPERPVRRVSRKDGGLLV